MSKIDCSVTVNFFREESRLCKSYGGKQCDERCPLHCETNGKGLDCVTLMDEYPDLAVDIVQKWSDENPVKTRLDDFKEKYPNAKLNAVGTPSFHPYNLGYCDKCLYCTGGSFSVCWNEPLEGGATGKAVK